jgi:glycosyltransferase involved in cell wall biosynthesis
MVIAVNTIVNRDNNPGTPENFIFETCKRLVVDHPDHTFVFITDVRNADIISEIKNVKRALIAPRPSSITAQYIWFNVRLNSILKKIRADLLISYEMGSVTSKVPQCIIVPGLPVFYSPEIFKRTHLVFYKSYTRKLLSKAGIIITFSDFLKRDILKHYKVDRHKMKVVPCGVSEDFKSVITSQREEIKMTYAQGHEYFIYTGAIGSNLNLLNLLKAFSFFKKRQKSIMRLILAGKKGWNCDIFLKHLKQYKFQNHVDVFFDLSEEDYARITAAAYTMIYPSRYPEFPTQALRALRCGVPVIVSSGIQVEEILIDSVLYADTNNYVDMAQKMMMLYKDEILKNEMTQKGLMLSNKFSWQQTSEDFWRIIDRYPV